MDIKNKYNYIRKFVKQNPNACLCSECLSIVDSLEGSFCNCCENGIVVRAFELMNAFNGKVPKMNEDNDLETINHFNIKAKRNTTPYKLIHSLWLSGKTVKESKNHLQSEGYKINTIKICLAFRKFKSIIRKTDNGLSANNTDIGYSW